MCKCESVEYQIPIDSCDEVVAAWLHSIGAVGVYVKALNGVIVEVEPLNAPIFIMRVP